MEKYNNQDAPISHKDSYYDALDAEVTKELGLPEGLLSSIRLNGERSDANEVSKSGAQSVYQITPNSRKLFLGKYGVDAYESPQAAAKMAGLHLKESLERTGGDIERAAQEYNAGPEFPKQIAAGRVTSEEGLRNAKGVTDYSNRVMQGMNLPAGQAASTESAGDSLSKLLGLQPKDNPFSTAVRSAAEATGESNNAKYARDQENVKAMANIANMFGMNVQGNKQTMELAANRMNESMANVENLLKQEEKLKKDSPVMYGLAKGFYQGAGKTGSIYQDEIKAEKAKFDMASMMLNKSQADTVSAMNIQKNVMPQLLASEVEAQNKLAKAQAEAEIAKYNDTIELKERAIANQEARTDLAIDKAYGSISELKANPKDFKNFQDAAAYLGFENVDELVGLTKADKELNRVVRSIDWSNPSYEAVQWAMTNRSTALSSSSKMAFNSAFGRSNGYVSRDMDRPVDPILDANGKQINVKKPDAWQYNIDKWRDKASMPINNKGTDKEFREEPYKANFYATMEGAKMTDATASMKLAPSTVLAKSLFDKNRNNSPDKQRVSDEDVILEARKLVADKVLTPRQAADELGIYFQASVDTNNEIHKFDKIGLGKPSNYIVPIQVKELGFYNKYLNPNLLPQPEWQKPKLTREGEKAMSEKQIGARIDTPSLSKKTNDFPPNTILIDMLSDVDRMRLITTMATNKVDSPVETTEPLGVKRTPMEVSMQIP